MIDDDFSNFFRGSFCLRCHFWKVGADGNDVSVHGSLYFISFVMDFLNDAIQELGEVFLIDVLVRTQGKIVGER